MYNIVNASKLDKLQFKLLVKYTSHKIKSVFRVFKLFFTALKQGMLILKPHLLKF